MKKIVLISCLFFLAAGTGCRSKRITRTDTQTSGVATIVSDDCFGNITNEEINVFEALNPDASIIPIYTDEGEALKLILDDSIRMGILARDLTQAEKDGLVARNRELIPRTQKIAIDGIAVVVNPANKITRISTRTLREIMTGTATEWKQVDPSMPAKGITVVFDGPNSSTARFIRDSICGGEALNDRLYSAKNNLSVIDYVTSHPDALGILGVNWLNNPSDSLQLSFNKAVRVLAVSRSHPATASNSYLPVPAYLYLREYPLTRDVYAILTDLRGTLPAGFTHFVGGDRGQRIILKSGLVPATRPIRTVEMKDTF